MFFTSFFSKACPVINAEINSITAEAKQIFKGAVTQMHWHDYESFIESYVPKEDVEQLLLRDEYSFKVLPITIYKGSRNIPEKMYGGGCYGFLVDGRNEYVFFIFDDPKKNIALHTSELTQKELYIISTANKPLKQDK